MKEAASHRGAVSDGEPLHLYFACVGNSARSQMAEAWAETLGGEAVEAASGGTDPKGHVLPEVVEAMAEVGVDVSGAASTGIDEAAVGRADLVVTMGCGEDCPAFLGKEVREWPLEDPDGMPLEGVRSVRDGIRDRVRGLLVEHGVEVAET